VSQDWEEISAIALSFWIAAKLFLGFQSCSFLQKESFEPNCVVSLVLSCLKAKLWYQAS
jgi:hypothetical protein